MSVLVKGMAMPKDCRVCPFAENVPPGRTRCLITCIMLSDNYCPTPLDWRHERCPLVEIKTPHGRLFDETEVKKCLQELTDCEDKWSAIALLEWAIEKRLCIEAEDE